MELYVKLILLGMVVVIAVVSWALVEQSHSIDFAAGVLGIISVILLLLVFVIPTITPDRVRERYLKQLEDQVEADTPGFCADLNNRLFLLAMQAVSKNRPCSFLSIMERSSEAKVIELWQAAFKAKQPNDVIIETLAKRFPWVVNNPNFDGGQTALHYCVIHQHTSLIKILFDHEVDPSIKDEAGRTAAEYLNSSIVQMVQSQGVLFETKRVDDLEVIAGCQEGGVGDESKNSHLSADELID